MKKLIVYPLFSKIMGESQEAYKITDDELDFIKNLERREDGNNTVTKNSFILELPKLKKLKIWIQENIDTYFYNVFKIKNINKIYITQSWSNITKRGQSHHFHNHPNSVLSGVMHFDDDDADLTFHTHESPFIFDFSHSELDQFNSTNYSFPTKKNKLFLFSSKIDHEVKMQTKDKDRMSLSFNTWVKGLVGEDQKKTLTEI